MYGSQRLLLLQPFKMNIGTKGSTQICDLRKQAIFGNIANVNAPFKGGRIRYANTRFAGGLVCRAT